MGSDKNVQYECKVCGRKIDVTRIGDVNEEPVYCCGLESAKVNVPEMPPFPGAPVAAVKKPAKKKAKKKAAKKKAKKKAVKKVVKKKAVKKAKKKASKKKVAKKKKKAAKKKRK